MTQIKILPIWPAELRLPIQNCFVLYLLWLRGWKETPSLPQLHYETAQLLLESGFNQVHHSGGRAVSVLLVQTKCNK